MTSTVFVDTSAIYAVLDADDRLHGSAAAGWGRLLDGVEAGELDAITHGSVLVETSALVQRRLGMEALRALHVDLAPVIGVRWVDEQLHERAVAALLAAGTRDISLVDWTSFELMREMGVREALAFDDDFVAQWFDLFPTVRRHRT